MIKLLPLFVALHVACGGATAPTKAFGGTVLTENDNGKPPPP